MQTAGGRGTLWLHTERDTDRYTAVPGIEGGVFDVCDCQAILYVRVHGECMGLFS